ncbi:MULTISPECIES: single-stranded DNA-binding protein [Corynebacterium]|uniref:Single-stranded DNA-binding protein n=2 Tax=Corynebacterium flavescens TaxID=28028 RepID=A0AB73B700_CORFL|nr:MULTISPECIES: single-stranded DNA-binding protein [Corynebacterium]KAA8720536.1 single-stranded DNA-binding protein [Corynebacterium flavescens]MDN6099050.1 single-stranded DNA-binding protein [Corynebacterium flavescens]MDN6198774.1 single-stranded DNA-binding protein [Corynebacterium flavescens]MDN6226762.1 single-stranded DNA-binding protein [Corynebacterium flavescens]MDN6235602.1 single-stranded DNA-binding protein [Corynebacterium flavescens]
MSQLPITITGHLTHEPELTKVSADMFKTRLRVASSRRVPNREHQEDSSQPEWRDIDLVFIDVEMWGQFAINVKKSLHKGMPIIAVGSIVTDQWQDKEGVPRSRTFIKAFYVGLDLNRYVIAAKKLAVVYNQENIPELSQGEEPVVPDIDRTRVLPVVAEQGLDDDAHDTAADRRQAEKAPETQEESENEPVSA